MASGPDRSPLPFPQTSKGTVRAADGTPKGPAGSLAAGPAALGGSGDGVVSSRTLHPSGGLAAHHPRAAALLHIESASARKRPRKGTPVQAQSDPFDRELSDASNRLGPHAKARRPPPSPAALCRQALNPPGWLQGLGAAAVNGSFSSLRGVELGM